jgi:hypothetical protein
MHEFQAELGADWIVSFSVHGDDAWLTAEKDDGSQHLEAQTAPVLRRPSNCSTKTAAGLPNATPRQ